MILKCTKISAVLFFWMLPLICNCQVLLEYFYQVGCEECAKVNALIIPQICDQFDKQIRIDKYDINITENYLKLVNYQEKMNVTSNDSVCMVINKSIYLGGFTSIEQNLSNNIKQLIDYGGSSMNNEPEEKTDILKSRAEKFTVGAVIVAGLIDGINPCVFATLIFFISLLSVSGVKGKKLLAVGSFYCLACFLAYLALGFGLFRFLKMISVYSMIQQGIEAVLILVLLIFAVISFRDAWQFRKTGKAGNVVLQIPSRIKQKIHHIMRKGLSYKYLLPGAFFIGILVTALESVCTGQVYVPTLVLLSKESGMTSRWFAYLLLYNFMFILPLILIFIASWYGASTSTLIAFSKKNVVWGKISLGVFFLLMALLMIILIL